MDECNLVSQTVLNWLPWKKPRFNVYDIRIPCEHGHLCYDFTPLETMIKKPEVRELLNVGDNKWSDCSMLVHTAMLGDWMVDLSPKVTYILEHGVNVLVYSGDKDWVCNWRGGEAWVDKITWTGQETY